MSSTIYAVLTTTETAEPAGQTYASTAMALTDGAGVTQTATAGPITLPDGSSAVGAIFTVTSAGAGSVVAQAIDTTGAVMGAPATGTFTIPATYPLPTSLVVTVV